MAYDLMGNYYSDEADLTEEERRRLRESGSISGPVAPDYNQYIAKNESGNRPDIGYHMPGKSTAYGTYGLTSAGYKDVQAANPAFAGRDITSLTPEEQTQAMDTYTQQNSKYLQGYGVEPTQGNLALAHFLGAKGAADYIKEGKISPAAAAANGGEEAVRKIADQRLSLGNAPVSGAAQPAPVAPVAPEQPSNGLSQQPGVVSSAANLQPVAPGQEQFNVPPAQTQMGPPVSAIDVQQAAQTDPYAQKLLDSSSDVKSLMMLGSDDKAPGWVQKLAQERALEQLTMEREKQKGIQEVKDMANKGDTTGLARMIAQSKEGSWGRAILFGLLGGGGLAREELAKMGYGSQLMKGSIDGQDVVYRTTPNGEPIQGYYASGPLAGQEIDNQQLAIVAAGGAGGGKTKPDVSLQDVEKTVNGQTIKGRVVTTYDRYNRPTTQVESGGKFYAYDGSWKPTSISTATEKETAKKQINLAWDPIIKAATVSSEELTKAGIKYGLNLGIAGYGANGAPIVVDKNTNQILQPNAQGQVTVTSSQLPAGGTQALATGAAVSEAAQKQFVEKTVPTIVEEGTNGTSVASIRKQQIDLIKSNPSILGIYTGSGDSYDRARNIITKLISGQYGKDNSDDFYKDLKSTGLSQNEQSALEQFGNLNMEINSKTLKANTGGGQISNAEQKINQSANLSQIAEQTPLASLQGLYRSQFAGDLNAYKQAYSLAHPELNTDAKFAQAWQKEQATRTKAYEGIMEARAEFLKQFIPPKNATPEQLNLFKDKVFKAFEMYPAPKFDASTGLWSYGTANAEKAAARKLIGQ